MFGLVPYTRRNRGLANANDLWNLDKIFDSFFNDTFFENALVSNSSIRADIKETEKDYVIDAELPGIDKKDIQLELKDDLLTIGVEQKQETEEKKENYIRRERRYGSLKRSFYVENVDNANIAADYKDGILKITLPKKEVSEPKNYKIPIQ